MSVPQLDCCKELANANIDEEGGYYFQSECFFIPAICEGVPGKVSLLSSKTFNMAFSEKVITPITR